MTRLIASILVPVWATALLALSPPVLAHNPAAAPSRAPAINANPLPDGISLHIATVIKAGREVAAQELGDEIARPDEDDWHGGDTPRRANDPGVIQADEIDGDRPQTVEMGSVALPAYSRDGDRVVLRGGHAPV